MSSTLSDSHISARLDLLELHIKKQLAIKRNYSSPEIPFDALNGMYISPEEIDAYLSTHPQPGSGDEKEENPVIETLDRQIEARAEEVDRLTEKLKEAELTPPLIQLKQRFHLTDTGIHILVCCAAPDIDARFHRLFAYLQDDVNLRRPTVQLLDRMFLAKPDDSNALTLFRLFRGQARIPVNSLFDHDFPGSREELPFPSRQFKLAPSVLDFLMGVTRLDSGLSPLARLSRGKAMEIYASYFDHHMDTLQNLLRQHQALGSIQPTYLGGPQGAGKSKLIHTFAHALDKNVLSIDFHRLLSYPGQVHSLLETIQRDARLHNAILHFHTGESFDTKTADPHGSSHIGQINSFVRDNTLDAVLITGAEPYNKVKDTLDKGLQSFYIPMPHVNQRYELWSRLLRVDSPQDKEEWLSGLAVKFRFTPGRIRTVLDNTAHMAKASGENQEELSLEDLYYCCREESDRGLLSFSQKIKPLYTWDDIVLPPDTRAQLQEICASIRNRQKVYWEWGFEKKFSLGKGLNVLLAGPPGIGKTMSAEIIANDLGLDLYKIDLSCVVSKYIGETEKNLGRIFREAETSNCILFFDEADALFGKRTKVKDSHDRYANIEVNYLLQKMEEYDGVVLLATNMRKNLDNAFTRRLQYVVDFPFPDEQHRASIWQRSFPRDVPMSGDIDFRFLAGRFKVSGGNIKNVAVNSAFLASSNGGKVNMENIILALKREYQKMGKMCSKSEFGQYYSLVNGDSP